MLQYIYPHTFFWHRLNRFDSKNHLLKSNIWCKNVSNNENDSKSEENQNITLFESIETDVLSKELKIHKEYLKNELIELETKLILKK